MASGTQLVGMVVMICCQTKVPIPRKTHQVHCSRVRGEVVNAGPPNCIIRIWRDENKSVRIELGLIDYSFEPT